jgi:hypothetical protein
MGFAPKALVHSMVIETMAKHAAFFILCPY